MSKYQKRSKRYTKQRIKVAKTHEHIHNQRKYFYHKLSRQITNNWDMVIVENLHIRGMAQSLYLEKLLMIAWGMFSVMIATKLKHEGKYLVKINRWYPSSKTCSGCENIKESLELSDKVYFCDKCGALIVRDYNAAINIKNEGIRQFINENSTNRGTTGLARYGSILTASYGARGHSTEPPLL